MADLPPGSVPLTDWRDSAGRVTYALTPAGEVWRLIYGGGLSRKVDLPRPIKPKMMGSRGRRYPFYVLDYRKPAVSLLALMREHFPLVPEEV